MTAILRDDKPPLATAGRTIHRGLERIVRHCLEKSPDERFQSARDLAFDLAAISGDSGTALSGPQPASTVTRRPRLVRVGLLATGLTMLAAVASWTGHFVGQRSAPRPPRFTLLTHRRGF